MAQRELSSPTAKSGGAPGLGAAARCSLSLSLKSSVISTPRPSSRPYPNGNIEASIGERLVNPLGGLPHEVDNVGFDLWAIGLGGLPMVEPMLVGVLVLPRTEARDECREGVCFDVRQE